MPTAGGQTRPRRCFSCAGKRTHDSASAENSQAACRLPRHMFNPHPRVVEPTECEWCFFPVRPGGGAWVNGGYGHQACVRYIVAVMCPDLPPGNGEADRWY
jgi:hypothetical protein